jgi:hypothetical protein
VCCVTLFYSMHIGCVGSMLREGKFLQCAIISGICETDVCTFYIFSLLALADLVVSIVSVCTLFILHVLFLKHRAIGREDLDLKILS